MTENLFLSFHHDWNKRHAVIEDDGVTAWFHGTWGQVLLYYGRIPSNRQCDSSILQRKKVLTNAVWDRMNPKK